MVLNVCSKLLWAGDNLMSAETSKFFNCLKFYPLCNCFARHLSLSLGRELIKSTPPDSGGAGRGKNLNELKHAMHLFIVVVEADKD